MVKTEAVGASANLTNARALADVLDRRQLQGLVVVSPKNVFYYTGSPVARTGLFDYLPHDPGNRRLTAAVVAESGGNVLICAESDVELNSAGMWSPEIESYDPYGSSPIEAIARAVQRKGLAASRLGFEAEYLTVEGFRDLRKLLPAAVLVACDQDLEWIRSLKTPGEIKLLKESADLLDDAFLEAFSTIHRGDTEWDFHSLVIESAMRRGAEYCRGFVAAGDNNDISFFGTNRKVLEPGDIVHTDYATYFHGYPSNLTRLGVVGEPSNLQRKKYANLMAIENLIVEFMRPGVTGQEVFRFCRKACVELGYLHHMAILGHNLGLGYHDRPMLTDAETMPLEVNNHIALEPLLEWTFHIQDQVLIEANGARIISDKFDTSELFVMD